MMALSLWRVGGAARLTLILVLLLTSLSLSSKGGGGGGVTGQLYTVLEDVAAYNDLPLEPIPSDKKVNGETTIKNGTCMAPFQNGPRDSNPNQAEEWAYYRTNIPKFGPIRNPSDRNGASGFVGDRLQAPHSRFWLEDPTAPEWYKHPVPKDKSKRESTTGTLRGLAIQEGKDGGSIRNYPPKASFDRPQTYTPNQTLHVTGLIHGICIAIVAILIERHFNGMMTNVALLLLLTLVLTTGKLHDGPKPSCRVRLHKRTDGKNTNCTITIVNNVDVDVNLYLVIIWILSVAVFVLLMRELRRYLTMRRKLVAFVKHVIHNQL